MHNYFVNIFVTDQCNFRCRYCYENGKAKNKESMSEETADSVVDFIKSTIKPDQILRVSFHGGEPLINFTVIKYIINKIRTEIPNEALFGMTTNGSLLNDEIVDYIAENMKYKLSVSIDGDEATQLFNRPALSGTYSFNDILKYAAALNIKGGSLVIRMTYDRKNISSLYSNIRFLIDYGFNSIIAETDSMSDEWEQEDFDLIYEQFLNVKEYIAGIKDRKITVYPVNSDNYCLGKCTAGHDYYHIGTTGKIYPCSMVMNNEDFCIGDTGNGINENALKKIDGITSKNPDGCDECTYKHFCTANRCIFINYASTGNAYSANLVMCNMMNVKRRLDKNT